MFLSDEKFSEIADIVGDVVDAEERQETLEVITVSEVPIENGEAWQLMEIVRMTQRVNYMYICHM